MALEGWYHNWFQASYFDPVWFAPADESGLDDEELREDYHGHGRSTRRKPSRPGKQEYARQFHDATEADIRALVEAKWDAINRPDHVKKTPVVSTDAVPHVQKPAEIKHEAALSEVQSEALSEAQSTVQAQRNDDALVMLLAELL